MEEMLVRMVVMSVSVKCLSIAPFDQIEREKQINGTFFHSEKRIKSNSISANKIATRKHICSNILKVVSYTSGASLESEY